MTIRDADRRHGARVATRYRCGHTVNDVALLINSHRPSKSLPTGFTWKPAGGINDSGLRNCCDPEEVVSLGLSSPLLSSSRYQSTPKAPKQILKPDDIFHPLYFIESQAVQPSEHHIPGKDESIPAPSSASRKDTSIRGKMGRRG